MSGTYVLVEEMSCRFISNFRATESRTLCNLKLMEMEISHYLNKGSHSG